MRCKRRDTANEADVRQVWGGAAQEHRRETGHWEHRRAGSRK